MRNGKSTDSGPSAGPDPLFIKHMFDRLARRYDLFNQLTSFGLAPLWRKAAVGPVRAGMRVMDLGCGTGDLVIEAARKMNGSGDVVGLDFSANMLAVAQRRSEALAGPLKNRIRFLLKSAEELPADEEPFDCVVSGFVLRNLYQNIEKILGGVYLSLKEGGGVSFLDITEPPNPLVLGIWKIYMNTLVGFYGKLLFGKDYPVFYLTESAKRFLKKDEFVRSLKKAGFKDVKTRDFMFGIIVLYQAVK